MAPGGVRVKGLIGPFAMEHARRLRIPFVQAAVVHDGWNVNRVQRIAHAFLVVAHAVLPEVSAARYITLDAIWLFTVLASAA